MRVGIAGLNALYWPVAMGNGLAGKPGVNFLAAATLGEDETVLVGLFEDRAGVFQLVLTEELPLRGAQPEHGSAVGVDEVPVVLADLDRKGRFAGPGDGPGHKQ